MPYRSCQTALTTKTASFFEHCCRSVTCRIYAVRPFDRTANRFGPRPAHPFGPPGERTIGPWPTPAPPARRTRPTRPSPPRWPCCASSPRPPTTPSSSPTPRTGSSSGTAPPSGSTGSTPRDAIGRPIVELTEATIVGDVDVPTWLPREIALATGAWHGRVIERPTTGRLAGREVVVEAALSRLADDQGTVTGVLNVKRDITASYRLERELATLGSLATATGTARSRAEIAQAAVDVLCSASSAEFGVILRFAEDRTTIDAAHGLEPGMPDQVAVLGQRRRPVFALIEQRGKVVVGPIETLPVSPEGRTWLEATGVGALAVVGIHRGEQLVGAMLDGLARRRPPATVVGDAAPGGRARRPRARERRPGRGDHPPCPGGAGARPTPGRALDELSRLGGVRRQRGRAGRPVGPSRRAGTRRERHGLRPVRRPTAPATTPRPPSASASRSPNGSPARCRPNAGPSRRGAPAGQHPRAVRAGRGDRRGAGGRPGRRRRPPMPRSPSGQRRARRRNRRLLRRGARRAGRQPGDPRLGRPDRRRSRWRTSAIGAGSRVPRPATARSSRRPPTRTCCADLDGRIVESNGAADRLYGAPLVGGSIADVPGERSGRRRAAAGGAGAWRTRPRGRPRPPGRRVPLPTRERGDPRPDRRRGPRAHRRPRPDRAPAAPGRARPGAEDGDRRDPRLGRRPRAQQPDRLDHRAEHPDPARPEPVDGPARERRHCWSTRPSGPARSCGRSSTSSARDHRNATRRPSARFIDAVRELQSFSQTSGIEWVVDVEPGLPRVPIDRSQIQQVLLNLTSNAIQAILSDRPTGRLEITARRGPRANGRPVVRITRDRRRPRRPGVGPHEAVRAVLHDQGRPARGPVSGCRSRSTSSGATTAGCASSRPPAVVALAS